MVNTARKRECKGRSSESAAASRTPEGQVRDAAGAGPLVRRIFLCPVNTACSLHELDQNQGSLIETMICLRAGSEGDMRATNRVLFTLLVYHPASAACTLLSKYFITHPKQRRLSVRIVLTYNLCIRYRPHLSLTIDMGCPCCSCPHRSHTDCDRFPEHDVPSN
jgi:hypothetical protein